ncbi:M23 family metallopeptidase [Chryseobacterium koreense]|uniref:M23ase beta-sheet core domain-containing protein n=1 Tax=Chryseobacterium koreense CCUG 49689 TaxID=1304281 RepID=A0A0J7J2W3_9FLAO|nr:M23 family metallopeptidase [Chryseobacterium koreense]KMQ72376.1 hypothetical protein ACM44_02040 [Chryseobacterium koreense CCUG 49689]MBB5334065.1 murein DD-endopeptidase MepM/ murein hydrolase activator NlpD [Chryseobacterium koreense]
MMKVKFKIAFLLFGVMCGQLLNAQFNTLKRSKVEKESITNLDLKIQNQKSDKSEKINRGIKLFSSPSKAELKRKIDSLKSSLIKNSAPKIKDKNFDFKRIEDSLIIILKANAVLIKKSKPLKTFDFIEDNELNLTSRIHMPLKNRISVTSSFGSRTHPIFGIKKMHNGADLKASYEKVYAVMDGIVTVAGWDSKGGGNYIKIKHSNSFVTSYLHLSEIYYRVGEYVKAGFIIAKSGNSGNSTGAHLHFSVSENGNYINPIHFLNDLIKANNLIATHYAN